MVEQAGTSKRAQLRERASQQELAAAQESSKGDSDGSPGRGGKYGNLAARAAALIAGQADPGAGKEEGEREEDPDTEDAPAGDESSHDPADTNDPDAPDQGEESEDEGADENQLPLTLDDAQKRLGMTKQEFNALEVKVGADTMTLGELKNRLPEVVKLDKAREEFEDERGSWELQRIGTYRNLHAIIDAIPKNPHTAGLLRQLERQHEETRTRELETLHFARPRWQDANYAATAKSKIVAMCADYGISRAEVEGLLDHRHLLLAQDFAELREKVRASREQAKKVNEPSGARPNGQGAPARRDQRENGANPRSNTGAGRREKPTQESVARRVGAIMRKR